MAHQRRPGQGRRPGREFGLPDLVIPMHGVSPLGFRIVEVIELGIPERAPDLFLNLTTDEPGCNWSAR